MSPQAATPAPKLDRRKQSPVALRAFFRIADLWKLTVDEQMKLLGLTTRSTFFNWQKDPDVSVPRDTLERISYILGIYSALQILLPNDKAADGWIKRPNANPVFGGKSALDRMLSGQVADLYVVRQYLDAQRGGWA
jgi:hypothetical protein